VAKTAGRSHFLRPEPVGLGQRVTSADGELR
jgi:hypothetical protein